MSMLEEIKDLGEGQYVNVTGKVQSMRASKLW